jgi:hypothetical protein
MLDCNRILGKKISVFFVALSFLAVNLSAQEVKTVSMSKYISNCLYNFSRYIDWPVDKKSGDFIITIVGSKEVYTEMSKLTQNMKVGQQSILVKYAASPVELSGFQHIIFVNDWQSNRFNSVMQKLSGTGTLVVTESEGMIGRGSMINFIPVNGMMQFEMSNENLKKNKLMASSILEKMAASTN